MSKTHTFHIPVMGTGYSIDSPIKVAKYGISSVISLVDDFLIESMRRIYCQKYGEPYTAITKDDADYRAKRITAYLNLVDKIVQKEFEALKASPFEPASEITKYFELLPDTSPLKSLYRTMQKTVDGQTKKELQDNLRELIEVGSIDVNIMTKLDRTNYAKDGTPLPQEFSDALAALRGYAQSTLKSAIVFSAGLNQRLYSYVSEFKDFYADTKGLIKKKIILKVSDYRSAIIQGKFFAKKGLWISEYRIESGLNCGGHAFATQGYLLGPILEEFKSQRQNLIASLHKVYNEGLLLKLRLPVLKPHRLKVTVQGGIGTAQEDKFLHAQYAVDSTGWGTPFLLCPEVVNVDPATLKVLCDAKEDDLYLSDVSPLGVPFNNVRGSLSDVEKERSIKAGTPGSTCLRNHLCFNTEFTEKPICLASRAYQRLKLQEVQKKNLPASEYQKEHDKIVDKACICYDLGGSVFINYGTPEDARRYFPAVCPGPNLAYFDHPVTLPEMIDHIYGRKNILANKNRPHMFNQELKIYLEYLFKEVKKNVDVPSDKQNQYYTEFKENLLQGIEYCRNIFPQMVQETEEYRSQALADLQALRQRLLEFSAQHPTFFTATPVA